MSTPTHHHQAYKSDHFLGHIQGLRAIAVLLVVVFHFWPGRLTGGYIGVDIFFVISGFLITGQLARELSTTSRIALPGFWAKRVRRLMPAALVVLIFSALATTFLMPLSYMPNSLTDISTSMLYVENWHLVAVSTDYLNNVNGTIAQHYWSLSVEEQFYIIWPLVLLGAFALGAKFAVKRRWGLVIAAVAFISLASLVYSITFTRSHPSEAYFVLFTRMFEFGAGALLVLLPQLRPRSVWLSNLLGLVGLAILFVASYKLTESTPFPSYWALIPVVGTVLILSIHPGQRWWHIGRLLSVRPLRFIGDISYSLYLWHWPLIFVAPFIIGWGLGTANRIALFVGSFLLAWLTKRYVEDPMRQLKALTTRKPRFTFGWMLVAFGLVGALLLGIFAVQAPQYRAAKAQLSAVQNQPPYCFGAQVATGCSNPALAHAIIPNPGFGNADEPSNPECFVQLNASALHPCHFGSSLATAPRVALVGDSHAYQYLNAFIRMAKTNGWSLTTYFKGACPWTTAAVGGSDPGFIASCTQYRQSLSQELTAKHFDVIVTSAYANTEYQTSLTAAQKSAGFAQAWTTQNGGAAVVAIADNPDFRDDPNKCLRSYPHNPSACNMSRADALVTPDPLIAASASAQASMVNFRDTFCGTTDCYPVIGGADVYRDENHLTVTYANSMSFRIAPAVEAALKR